MTICHNSEFRYFLILFMAKMVKIASVNPNSRFCLITVAINARNSKSESLGIQPSHKVKLD